MKVGMLTFHKADNYGAVLQAHALQNYLIRLGCEAEIIDYRPNIKREDKRLSLARKLGKYFSNPIDRVKARKYARARTEKFDHFRKKNLILSEESYNGDSSMEADPPYYDCYIVGSDQVWNTDLSNRSKAFYLHFVKEGKKISYAASFGKSDLGPWEDIYIRNYLDEFDSISIREKHHARILADQYNIQAQVTLDPVFLLNKTEWKLLRRPIEDLPERYVLVYALEYSEDLFEAAEKKAAELDCQIIYISLIKEKIKGRTLKGIGPSEFLYAFSKAAYVCTNSFHGVSFSIIFKKDFTVIEHSSRNMRIDNILDLCGLSHRKYSENDMADIDYEEVEEKINTYIQESKDYIKESLSII